MEDNLKMYIIRDLSEKRYSYIEQREQSWDEASTSYAYDPAEIDMLGSEIMSRLREFKDDLPFEFIFEELTKLGQAPNLLYDDDGRFAVTGEGFQTVASGEATDIEMQFYVYKKLWKDTVREALYAYLDEDE